MFKRNVSLGLFFIIALFFKISCSKNSEADVRTNVSSPIKGEWTLQSNQDYLCGSGEITNVISDVGDIVRIHYDFGVFEVYIDGELIKEESGDYEVLENNYYRFVTPEKTYTVKVEVSDDKDISTMWFDVDQECQEKNGELVYTYSTWSRTVY
jgi:hypothetical protein